MVAHFTNCTLNYENRNNLNHDDGCSRKGKQKKQQLDSLARGGFGARNARYLRPRRRGGGGVAAERGLIESLPRRAARACTAPNF